LRAKVETRAQPPDAGDSPVLTIFSAPKTFRGHVGIIQDNAIRSWSALKPRPRIILFGNDSDTADAAERLEVEAVTHVAANAHGTPLLSDMFRQADTKAAGDVLAFISADIILTQNAVEAARLVAAWATNFLIVAQRYDVDMRERIDFKSQSDGHWMTIAARGRLHSPGAIDVFIYRRGMYADMPPFAIGRTAYDNWLLWKTVTSDIPLIDATDYVTVLHQNHDYSHAPTVDVWNGLEAQENRSWIKHWSNYYTIVHANWKLRADGSIVRATEWKYRMARPRQFFSHALRGTRRLRTRFQTWRISQGYRD
jgi:hypothetical protein